MHTCMRVRRDERADATARSQRRGVPGQGGPDAALPARATVAQTSTAGAVRQKRGADGLRCGASRACLAVGCHQCHPTRLQNHPNARRWRGKSHFVRNLACGRPWQQPQRWRGVAPPAPGVKAATFAASSAATTAATTAAAVVHDRLALAFDSGGDVLNVPRRGLCDVGRVSRVA